MSQQQPGDPDLGSTDGTAASDDVGTNVGRLDDLTTAQSERLTLIGGELSEFRDMLESLQDTVVELDERSSDTAQRADTAKTSAQLAIQEVENAQTAASEAYEGVEALQAAVEEIDEMTALIEDIADQTNMLALNASIEAARVGKEGEGFAVVADEVKNLAEEAQSHAVAIDDIVAEVRENAETTIDEIQDVESTTTEAVESMDETVSNLEGIDESAWETSEAIGDLSDQTDEHAAKVDDIASMVIDAIEDANDAEELVSATAAILDKNPEVVADLDG